MAEVLINSLDDGNPLQNNANSNAPIVTIKLYGSDNYKMWSTAMRIALKGKNKIGFVDGTYVRPVTSLVLSQEWESCNSIVLGWILRSLSPKLYLGKVYSEFACEVWQEFYDKIDGFIIFNVIHKIHGLKQGELFVPDYYHKLNSLWREFDTLTLLPAYTCAAHEGVLKHNQEPLPDVKEAFNVVSREESHRGLHPGFGSSKGNSNSRNFNGSAEAQRDAFTSIGSTTFDNAFTKEQILNLTVGHPNGILAKITAIGNLRLTANIVLFDVLVVHEYCVSFLSVHKLIKDSCFTCDDLCKYFLGHEQITRICHLCNIPLRQRIGCDIGFESNQTIGTCNESGGLYVFDEDKNVLSILSKNIGLKYDKHVSPCDICLKAKEIRDPFPLSDHKSISVGDLVHLDLWGPYRVVSRDGYKYFVTIADHYSRAMWAYLIKSKDEIALYIKSFVELINN
ncbi:ribonuclease H-like domain-containing protein [Tanacetum coccineum]